MKTIEEIEDLFVKACDKAIAEGWKIQDGDFINSIHKECCPIAALCNRSAPVSYIDKAAGLLDAEPWQLEDFYMGFDGLSTSPTVAPFYTLGQKLRARYITK